MYYFQKICALFILGSILSGINSTKAQEEISEKEHQEKISKLIEAHKLLHLKSSGKSTYAYGASEIILPTLIDGKDAIYFYSKGKAYFHELKDGKKTGHSL